MSVTSHELKYALSQKHRDDFFLTEVKNGPTNENHELSIIDALAIKKSWTKPCITGYEIKVSRNDFLNDSKWPSYRDMCHRLSFVCPTGLIERNELPEDIGLIWYKEDKGTLYTRKKSRFRDIGMHANTLFYIIMNRLENVEHPFFSTKRDYLEAYAQDRVSAKKLGTHVNSNLIRQTANLEDRLNKELHEKFALERKADKLEEAAEILRNHGHRASGRNLPEVVEEMAQSAIPRNIQDDIESLERITRELKTFTGVQNDD